MPVYTVALAKGGIGKTSTAAELAFHLARRGRRVLAVDLDQQGNLTRRLGITDDTEVGAVTADVLIGEATAGEAAVAAPELEGVWVIAGTSGLADIEHRPEVLTSLRDYLPTLAGEWDDVVIDTPTAMGIVTLSGIAAADVMVATVECKTEAYDALGRLGVVIEERIARRIRPGQRVHWVVPTLYDSRRLLDREVVQLLRERHPGRVTATVRQAIAVADSYTAGLPVSLYAPNSTVAADYQAAVEPIIATSSPKPPSATARGTS